MGRRRKKNPTFVLGEEQEFPTVPAEQGYDTAYVQIGSVRITNHGLGQLRQRQQRMLQQQQQQQRQQPFRFSTVRQDTDSEEEVSDEDGGSDIVGRRVQGEEDEEQEEQQGRGAEEMADGDGRLAGLDASLSDYLRNVMGVGSSGLGRRKAKGGGEGKVRGGGSQPVAAGEGMDVDGVGRAREGEGDMSGEEAADGGARDSESGEAEGEAEGEEGEEEQDEEAAEDDAMLGRLLQGFAGRDLDGGFAPPGLGAGSEDGSEYDSQDEDEDEDEELEGGFAGHGANLYEALMAVQDGSSGQEEGEDSDDDGALGGASGGSRGELDGGRGGSRGRRHGGTTPRGRRGAAALPAGFYYEIRIGEDGKERYVRVEGEAGAAVAAAGRGRGLAPGKGSGEEGLAGDAQMAQASEAAAAAECEEEGEEGDEEVVVELEVDVVRFPFMMRSREQVRAERAAAAAAGTGAGAAAFGASGRRKSSAAAVMAASASGGATPAPPRSRRSQQQQLAADGEEPGRGGGGGGGRPKQRSVAKGALDGALRPGEKKQLRKDKIEAKRAARDAVRGFNVRQLAEQVYDFVNGGGDVLALEPLGKNATALAQKIAGIYGLRHSLQGSGKKRFLLLQPTDRTRSPDEKTQDKVDKIVAAEVARQQRGAAAGAGVGPEGAAMHDVTPATVAAARRGRGGGGGGGSKRAQEQAGGATPRSAARSGAFQQPVTFVSSGVQRDGQDQGQEQDQDQGSEGEGEDAMGIQVAEGAEDSGASMDGASPGLAAKPRRPGVTVVPPRSAAAAEAEAAAAMDGAEEAVADGDSGDVEEREAGEEEEQEQHAGLGLGTWAELQQREWLEAALGVSHPHLDDVEEADEESEEDEGGLDEDGGSKHEADVGWEAAMGGGDTGQPLGDSGATGHTAPPAVELAPPPASGASGAGPPHVGHQQQQQQAEDDVTVGVVSYIRSHFRIGPGYDREERRLQAPAVQHAHPHPQVFGLGMLGGGGGGDGGAGVRVAGGDVGAGTAAGGCGTEGEQHGSPEAPVMEVEGGRLSEQESEEDQEPERRGRGRAIVGGDRGGRKGKGRDSRGGGGADGYGGGGGGGGAAGVIGRTAQQDKRAGKKAAKEARRQQRREEQQQQGPRVRQMRGCSVEEPVGAAGAGGEGAAGGGAPADLSYDFASFERFTSGIGSRLMGRMGWAAGEGLGRGRQGRSEPLRPAVRPRSLGLGADG